MALKTPILFCCQESCKSEIYFSGTQHKRIKQMALVTQPCQKRKRGRLHEQSNPIKSQHEDYSKIYHPPMMGSVQKRTTKQICISSYKVPMTSWIATPTLGLHFLNTRGICCTATPKHALEYSKVLFTKTKVSQTQHFTAGLQPPRVSAGSPSNLHNLL